MGNVLIVLWVFVGILWQTYCHTQPMAHEIRERVRQRDGSLWFVYAGIVVGAIFWPLSVFLTFGPAAKHLRTAYRRRYLDRPDLLQPQMPPPRCPIHDRPLRVGHDVCCVCNKTMHTMMCAGCRTDLVLRFHPQPVPKEFGPICSIQCMSTALAQR